MQGSQVVGKIYLLNKSACICNFCLGLELKKFQTAASKYLGIFPKIQRGGNSARVWVKTVTLVAIIVFLVYSVMWCGGSAKYDSL